MATIKLPKKPLSMVILWIKVRRSYRDLSPQADPARLEVGYPYLPPWWSDKEETKLLESTRKNSCTFDRAPPPPPLVWQTSQVLTFPKSEIFAGDYAKSWSILFFLVLEGPKNSRGLRGHASSENLLNSLGMHSRVRHLSFKPCFLGASMLLRSARANTRNKKIDRARTDWTLAEIQCQWRNELGIHEQC